MKNTQEIFEGLTITLKKRQLNINDGYSASVKKIPEGNDYLVLGHYDQMSVHYINRWWDWAPSKTESISLEDIFIDKYSIKAYFPNTAKRAQYSLQKFDYDIWKEPTSDVPFIVSSVINISEEYAKEILDDKKNVCDAFASLILTCIDQEHLTEKWPHMHCAVLPTIGFSDFLLLFKTTDLNSTLNLLEGLKETYVNGIPCLSNAYTMIGFCNKGLDHLSKQDVGGIKLAIRFGLKDGISARQFHLYFKQKLLEESKSKERDGIEKNYRILGDSDFLIVSNIELQQVLSFYFCEDHAGLFHPAHDMFKYYIRSMQSEVRVNSSTDDTVIIPIDSIRKEKNITNIIVQYTASINKLKSFIRTNHIPERIIYGMQIVMKRYLQLIQSGHCFDMESIIGGAFVNLLRCMEQNIESAESLEDEDKYEKIQYMLDALNTFRSKIGDYLADMQRSDSLFLEGRSLSHPSIGSATKLLFFYNGYIDSVKNALCPKAQRENYQFIVTSGGTDQTQAIDLFSHLNPSRNDACSVILMTVPEASLYDVKSSLFHALHEMLHYCGERKRELRFQYVIEAVSAYTASFFGDFLKISHIPFYDETRVFLSSYMSPAENTSIQLEIDALIDQQTDNLKSILKDQIKKQIWNQIPKNLHESDYFGRSVYSLLYTVIEDKVFVSEDSNQKVKLEIYECFTQYRYALSHEIKEVLFRHRIPYSDIDLICTHLETMVQCIHQGKYTEYSPRDMDIISCIIDLYLGKDIRTNTDIFYIADEDADIDLDALLITLRFLFEECYADCMASEILELYPPHFIFSFLTEARNEQNAFISDSSSRLRIITDLDYLYNIKDTFPEDILASIRSYAEKIQENDMNYVEVDSLISWLQNLIETSESKERVSSLVNPVKDYLRECKAEWRKQNLFNALKNIKTINKYSEMDTPDNIYGFLDSVSDQWIYYARQQR